VNRQRTGNILVLASSSQQRRQLLAQASVPFQAVDPPLAEPDEVLDGLDPVGQAEALAYFKARAVSETHPEATVMAADTVVAVGQEILGKPSDAHDARRMLTQLSGTRHRVITGVALIEPRGKRTIDSDVTYVTMREMTEREIQAYIDSGEWIGKAGAYAIQLSADRYVEKIEGSFTNVVGLPMELVARLLARLPLAGKLSGESRDAGQN